MNLTDTGPLVALVNKNDPNYAACLSASKRLPLGPLVTTWPCFTEAMFLARRGAGYPGQAAIWRLKAAARLAIYDLTAEQVNRMAILMDTHRDGPMDLADASLIAVAESLAVKRIFTIDSDFYFYPLADGSVLEVIK